MAGASFKLDFNTLGLESYINSLARLDLKELLDNIGALVETQTLERFEAKKDPQGSAWQAWSERYKKSGKGKDILRNTQRLFDSINYQVKGNKVEVGTNVVYSATHNYGDKSRNIPKRQFLGISKNNEKEINTLVKAYIEGLANE